MFENKRYVTIGVADSIPLGLQFIMWTMVDVMDVPKKDYLQVFHLTAKDKTQIIEHSQEMPDYNATHDFPSENPLSAHIYIIDDGDHSTMLLAEEY